MPRPRGVILIAVIVLLDGLWKVSSALLVLIATITMTQPQSVLTALRTLLMNQLNLDLLSNEVLLILGIFELIAAIGMLRLRPWAWLMAMITQGAALANALASYPQNGRLPFDMLLAIIFVFYLNQRHIRHAFVVAQNRADPHGILTAEATRPSVEGEE